jgi:hypothetical protein
MTTSFRGKPGGTPGRPPALRACTLLCVQFIFIVSVFSVHGYHTINKTYQESTAYKDDQIGGKKGHNEEKRIFQLVGCNQKLDSKYKKKARQQDEKYLSYPPENTRHVSLIVPFSGSC